MEDLAKADPIIEDDKTTFHRRGSPFLVKNDLLYHIQADGSRSLYVPHELVPDILEMAHDEKHHFGRDRMLYDLRNITIHNKTRLVRKRIGNSPSQIPTSMRLGNSTWHHLG
ncbi:hypothetical protein GE21DRAFT_1217497 [Neurospora crassa]|nr:hypothetical protein GE21DRAFT_1217497 [Neurospora crassa]